MDWTDSDNTYGEHYPDNPSSDESDFSDLDYDLDNFDIAITHDRNTTLKERHLVKKFFTEIRELKSLADQKTRSWLGNLPFSTPEDAIPLFVDGDDHGDDSVDYQLHPHCTLLELDKTARRPDNELCRLSIDGNMLEDPNLVIGIGRLFVNVGDDKAGRTSKWTGYEVFVDKELALWMVFDRYSVNPQAADWYPFPCRLSQTTLQDSGDGQQVISRTPEERRFDIACFLPSLRGLSSADFKTASEKVQEKIRCGKMRVCQVERSEIDKLLETESAPQEVSADNTKLREAILNAVGDGRKTAQKTIDLLDKHKHNLGMIREVITEKVLKVAAGNEGCGNQIMTILLDRFENEVCKSITPEVVKAAARNDVYGEQIVTMLLDRLKDEVCKNISPEVVKAAAGNWQHGAQITEKLLKVCGDAVCENLSSVAICTAAENGKSGAQILELLLKADEEKVSKLIEELYSQAKEGQGWPKDVLPKLKERLKAIGYTIGYPITSGMQPEQRLTLQHSAPLMY